MSNEAMERIRAEVVKQVGDSDSVAGEFDPASVVRFAPHLPERLEPAERERLIARVRELEPWLQGPFLLGGDLVVGGLWRIDSRWENLGEHIPELGDKRVLDVGSNAGYDPFMFNLRGAAEVLACEPFEFIEQAHFLESIYRTGIRFERIGWQELSAEEYGQFDLVHCHGVLYHEVDPVALLARLHEMTAPGGMLIFGSMMLADPEASDLSRFVPRAYFRDDTWWWVPGPLAVRSMLESVGFEVEEEFGFSPGPDGEFPTINGYFRATRPA
jgi:tRNA (mo5U34)-methyltransferase